MSKTTRLNLGSLRAALGIIFLLMVPAAYGAGKQLHVRAGMLKGTYSGPVKSSFMIIPSIDVEMELFSNAKVSTVVRANIAIDIGKAKVFSSGVGVGQRYYLGSPGMVFDRIEDEFSIESYSQGRYFIGWDVGIAQVLIKELTAAYSVVGSVVELGGVGGYIFQISKSLGVVLAGGASFGVGFTTVSVNGLSIRGSAGVAYSF